MTKSYLAIVTARSGSKRLPEKNIKKLCGRPLFVWSVLAGLECPKIERVIVSTDSPVYQEIAIKAGAESPWLRNPRLATDTTSSVDVVRDVLEQLGDDAQRYRGLVLLQPTSPLRNAMDVTHALDLFETRHASAVVSVSETECPPAWIGQIPTDLVMDDFISPEFRGIRSQDLGKWYRLNGAIYIIGINEFMNKNTFMPPGTLAHIMPRERSVDIDTEFDFNFAAFLMNYNAIDVGGSK